MVLRILKMIATSGFLTALECTKFVFDRGPAPNPAGGAYSTPLDPLAGLRGLLPREGEREKKEGTGKGKKQGDSPPPFRKFLDPPLLRIN